MAIKVGKGRAEVTIEGSIADNLEREIRGLLGPVVDAMDAEADKILANIQKEWPVKTGKSRDAWAKFLRVQPSTFIVEVVLSNPYDYVRYVKSTKVGSDDNATRLRSPLQTLVRKPAREAEKALKTELPAILAKRLGDVYNG